jgi:hypothetical protein
MNLGKGTVVHATETAKTEWETCGKKGRTKKSGCPSCDLAAIAKKSDEIIEEEKQV